MKDKPLFTIIMLTYNRPHLLKEAVACLFAQTYTNLEIIIINNAATPQTQEYLALLERQDSRIKLVHFQTNQYDPTYPNKFIGICHNAALNIAKGEYIFYQEDDDFISPDYVERMVALFQGDPECITAAGRTISVNIKGELIVEPRVSNFRPRYMQGHSLALDTLRNKGGRLFSAPGTIFSVKREVLIKAGGFHPVIESSYLYGIVPFGVTGFDEKALLHWRRHPDQMNRSIKAGSQSSVDYHKMLLNEWGLHKKWEDHFGKKDADFFVRMLIRQKTKVAVDNFIHCLFVFSWSEAWGILSKTWRSWYFWEWLPSVAWQQKWELKISLINIFRKKSCPESLSQAH